MFFEIRVCFLNFCLVGCVCFGTRLDAVAQFDEIVPCCHELINVLAQLQRFQFVLIAFHEALLCQNDFTVMNFCLEDSLREIGIRCSVVSIAVNVAGIVNACLSGERNGYLALVKCLVPYDLRLVAVQQITEFAAHNVLFGNLGSVALMRTELVDEVTVVAGNIIRIAGKGVGIALSGINLNLSCKGTVGKCRFRT